MQVCKLLVVALVCVILISGAEMSAGAGDGAAAVPRAVLRASVVLPAALPHAAVVTGKDPGDRCCRPGPNCCASDDDDAALASDDSP
jgi:hypothetical protein